MHDLKSVCRVALVQAEPVLFDKAAGMEKTLRLIREACATQPDLIVFPELFVPGYPFGMNFGFGVGRREEPGRADWLRYAEASMLVPGPETEALAAAAKALGVYLSIGVSERVPESGTLYNTNLIFSRLGRCAVTLLPGRGYALGADGQPHLLGELYAAGARRAL